MSDRRAAIDDLCVQRRKSRKVRRTKRGAVDVIRGDAPVILKKFEIPVDDGRSRDPRHARAAQVGRNARLRINLIQLVNRTAAAGREVEVGAIVRKAGVPGAVIGRQTGCANQRRQTRIRIDLIDIRRKVDFEEPV